MVDITPGKSSYWSDPASTLDPSLFDEKNRMLPEVRNSLLTRFRSEMGRKYHNVDDWAHVWLAGSGASYQWQADRSPGDLDMLIGVDYPTFRYHNEGLRGLTDDEISWVLNTYMRRNLSEPMANWNGFEVTWYNNPQSMNIRDLNPYAAYSLTKDTWHVFPTTEAQKPAYSPDAHGDLTKAKQILTRYNRARRGLASATVGREAHASAMNAVLAQASALFDEIHNQRRGAFLPGGSGYLDERNARWQAGKESGVIPMLKMLREEHRKQMSEKQIALYGMEFPDPNELRIRAMLGEER